MRSELSSAGVRALDAALESIAVFADRERLVEAAVRYARAVDLADELRAEWISWGRPKLYTASNGNICAHPLVKMVRDAEADAAKYGKVLHLEPPKARAKTGRPSGSSSAPDRKPKQLPPILDVDPEEPAA